MSMSSNEQFNTSGTVYNTTFDKDDFLSLERLLVEQSEIEAQRFGILRIELRYPNSTLETRSFISFFKDGDFEVKGNPSSVGVTATSENDRTRGWSKYVSIEITNSSARYYITGTSQTWVLGKEGVLLRFFRGKQSKVFTIPPIVNSLAQYVAIVTTYLGVNGLLQQKYLIGATVLIVSAISYLSIDSIQQRLQFAIPSGIFFLERPARKVNYPLLQLCVSLLGPLVALIIGILNLSKATP